MKLLLALLLSCVAFITQAKAEWPQNAFTCRAYRADLYWNEWARRHCPEWRWRQWRRWRHVPYASGDALCQAVVTATGVQAQSVKTAEDYAITSWQGAVRFKYGERFIDFNKARDTKRECSQSSVPDAWRDEKAPTLFRCLVIGRPCRIEARPLRRGE